MSKKILIVDDQTDIVKVLTYCFEKEGFEVETADNGETALDLILKTSPDLVLLDLRIPGLDGRGVCKCVNDNAASRKTHILFFSASNDALTPQDLKELEADGLITKPFDMDDLMRRVKEITGSS